MEKVVAKTEQKSSVNAFSSPQLQEKNVLSLCAKGSLNCHCPKTMKAPPTLVNLPSYSLNIFETHMSLIRQDLRAIWKEVRETEIAF